MLKKLGKLLWSPVGWSGCGTSFFNVAISLTDYFVDESNDYFVDENGDNFVDENGDNFTD